MVNNDQIHPTKKASCNCNKYFRIIGLIRWPEYQRKKKKRRGRPYVYDPTVILRCFVVRIWLRLDSNRALHDEFLAMDYYYPYNRKIMKACGLTSLPDRRTFDRRLSNIYLLTSKKGYPLWEIDLSRKD